VILLDCAPSADLLHFAALVAADYLLIPTRLDKLAVNGVRDALQTLAALKRISRCQVAGILPTFYERVTLESHEQLIHLAQTFGKLGAAAYPPGYPMPCGDSLREDAVGLRSKRQSLEWLRARQPASGRISTSFRTSKGMAMKNEHKRVNQF
jgi:cellulose biosynthesis protein BcsQ